ncbi:MAG: hypothetical protein ACXVKT_18200 [Flavisolibacter sp.]
MNVDSIIDISVFVIANLTNLLLALMFLFRGRARAKTGSGFGWAAVILGIPLLAAAILNVSEGRPWWSYVLPGLLVLYDLVEFILDYLLKYDFRRSRWLGPYLGLYYLALMGMIGYAFAVGRPFGFVTLVTYFINLAATAWSFARVQHG